MREGRFIPAWKVAACQHCLTGNGLPMKHPAIQKLVRQGVDVKAAANGIVSWPGTQAPPQTANDSHGQPLRGIKFLLRGW